MVKYKSIDIDNTTYPVKIIYKRKMNYSYKYNGKEFVASVPYFALFSTIKDHLSACAKKLIKKYNDRFLKAHNHTTASGHIYLFGEDSEYLTTEELYH